MREKILYVADEKASKPIKVKIYPMKIPKPLKTKSPIPRLRSQADRLIFMKVMSSNPKCVLCGRLAIQLHHFKPKSCFGHLRYEPLNLIPLCVSDHFRLTHIDPSLEAKIALIKGTKWHKRIEELAKNRSNKTIGAKFYREVIESLK